LVVLLSGLIVEDAWASESILVDGDAVAMKVAQRKEGAASRRNLAMMLIDKRGKTRRREALVIKRQGVSQRHTRITYLSPKSVREVAFLSQETIGATGAGQRWLYLPVARKARRIPAADRGDYFLGTDFSYEDMQSELKFSLTDYSFELRGTSGSGESLFYQLHGVPQSPEIARELGYGGFSAEIDARAFMPIEIRFNDLRGRPLKTVSVSDLKEINGIWTAGVIECVNHQTRHSTRFEFSEIRYLPELPMKLFQSVNLQQGIPKTL
jgi:hypothetical protein